MIILDLTALGLGAFLGLVTGAVFFAGLAWGMRIALSQPRPTPVLLVSAALRIAGLLAVGWWVAGQGVSALAGFALAFLMLRFAVLVFARRPIEAASWN